VDGRRNFEKPILFKTARFYAVYGSGGFSVGVSKSFRVGFIGPTSLTHQFQAKPCGCSRRVASIIERIDLGCASNPMRVLISLTAPLLQLKVKKDDGF
jgi:hypothetical protein